jgi:hypothetical protein
VEAAVSIVIGGIITILTAIGVEYFRKPRLHLTIEEPPCDVAYPAGTHPATNARHLRLKLRNERLPFGARWMQRATALQCRGEITFHHLDDGQDIFGRAMAARWANSPQPIANQIVDLKGSVQFQILDFARAANESRVDVYPGEEQVLDVASRFDDEPDCYGWNNEAYLHQWHNPLWRLPQGRYLAKIVVTSSGQTCRGVFRIVNDVPSRTDFRLLEATEADKAKVM